MCVLFEGCCIQFEVMLTVVCTVRFLGYFKYMCIFCFMRDWDVRNALNKYQCLLHSTLCYLYKLNISQAYVLNNTAI